MATCWVISGLVLLALSFIACAISLVAPYWVISNKDLKVAGEGNFFNQVGTELQDVLTGREHNYGLWAQCTDNSNQCTWFFEDDFKWEEGTAVWWKAAQAMFAFGVLLILIAFLVACIYLCSACCKSFFSVIHLINGLLIFAFISLSVSLALFGAKMHELHGMSYDPKDNPHFWWGYWVGCGGALLNLLAIMFYSCEGCRGGSPAGYSRGEVV